MFARFTPFAFLLGLSVLLTAGCDRSSEHSRAVADLEKRVEALDKRVQQLEAELATARGGPATAVAPAAITAIDTAAAEPNSAPTAATDDDRGSLPVAPATAGIEVVANPELKGSMGRIVVAFPKETKTEGALVTVNKAGERKSGTTAYGNLAAELLPGQYELVISGARVGGAEVKARHDTRIPVGVLRIATSANDTSVAVLTADGSKEINVGYGSRDVGLPAGKYLVKVAGQTAPVEIKAGEVTAF